MARLLKPKQRTRKRRTPKRGALTPRGNAGMGTHPGAAPELWSHWTRLASAPKGHNTLKTNSTKDAKHTSASSASSQASDSASSASFAENLPLRHLKRGKRPGWSNCDLHTV